jgi:hypothetical protein
VGPVTGQHAGQRTWPSICLWAVHAGGRGAPVPGSDDSEQGGSESEASEDEPPPPPRYVVPEQLLWAGAPAHLCWVCVTQKNHSRVLEVASYAWDAASLGLTSPTSPSMMARS